MKKVLVITDSLGLPRAKPDVVNYEETWVYLLSEKFNIHQFSLGGGTIGEMYTQIGYLKMFKPDLVIVQAGIVDSAPRALSKFENEFFNKYYLTRKFIKLFLKPKTLNFLRKNRNCAYTNIKEFEKYITLLNNDFLEKLYWIEIVPVSDEYENKVPGIKKRTKLYNDLLQNHLKENLITTNEFTLEHIMPDFIHLSKAGHFLLFDKLVKQIN